MPSVVYAECCKLALHSECYYAECRYSECHGAVWKGSITVWTLQLQFYKQELAHFT
jgi:hypothetical protein